jgi:hypothetical protein
MELHFSPRPDGATKEPAQGASVVWGLIRSVAVVDVRWHGSSAIETHLQSSTGKCGKSAFISGNKLSPDTFEAGRPRSFDGDSSMLHLVSEYHRSKS